MLYLASTSPRRHQILSAAGFRFQVCAPGDEVVGVGTPMQLAAARAESKSSTSAVLPEGALVLGVDTVVACDEVEFGKPVDRDAAVAMLRRLSGREHDVWTAHTLRIVASDGTHARSPRSMTRIAAARVACAALDDAEIEAYLARDEWRDKAGGYGIQGAAGEFMTLLRGDFDTVVGLNVRTLRELLGAMGVRAT